jgi:hypothetical protein
MAAGNAGVADVDDNDSTKEGAVPERRGGLFIRNEALMSDKWQFESAE